MRFSRHDQRVDTIVRGNAAEAGVLHACVTAGLPVYLPFGGGSPVDLVVLTPGGSPIRVQVKCGRLREGRVEFNVCATDHGRGREHYRGRADVIAAHVAELDQVFVIPVDDCPHYMVSLRLEPARNNQRKRVRMAEDHTFERWVASLG
jgi:hypothetical protein